MSKTRSIEYYRLWDDHTWDTDFIDIPSDTPDDKIEEVVRDLAYKLDWQHSDVPVAVGVYNTNEDFDADAEWEAEQAEVTEEKDRKNGLYGPEGQTF